MAGPNSSFLDPLLSPTIQDDGDAKTRRANINYIGFTVEDDPTNDATKITATGGGGGGTIALADHAAFRALSSPPADGTVINFQSPIGTFVVSTTEGAGQADDDKTILKRTAVSIGANERAYSTDGPILPTIAALRLAVSGKQSAVHVQAYTTGGDGGGGIFDDVTGVVSTADDGGVIIHAGSRVFKRRNDGIIDIRWYGILPNDTSLAATNTTRMNALLALLAGKGATVHAPRGIYYFAASVTLQFWDLAGLHLYGDGINSPNGTLFQYYTAGTAPVFHAPWISLVGSFDCIIEGIYFFAQPIGGSGGVFGSGTSPVDFVIKTSSHTEAGADHGGCSRNHLEKCVIQGGLIAGWLIGNNVNDLGSDTNLDQNTAHDCRFNANDGMGVIVSSANTSFTKLEHCSFETNGKYHVDIIGFPRATVFSHCAMSNPGMLDGPNRTTYGYAYHVWNSFGPESLVIEDQTFELGYGVLKTDVSNAGVEPIGQIILRNIRCTNNNATGFHAIKALGSNGYDLENCLFKGTGAEGHYEFTATNGTAGPRTITTRNVVMSDGATLDVTNFIWDGAGVIHMTGNTDNNPSVTRITIVNSDVASNAAIAGSKITPTFPTQVVSSGTGSDTIQMRVLAHSSQTANLQEWQNSSSVPQAAVAPDGKAFGVGIQDAPVWIGPYPSSPGSHGSLYMGVPYASRAGGNFVLISNGTTTLLNAPDATSEIDLYCGFNQVATFKYNSGSPFIRFPSTATDPKVFVDDVTGAGATAPTFHIRAPNATGAGATTGGKVSVESGSGATKGAVELTVDTSVKVKCDNNGVSLVGGTSIKGHLSATATLSFGTITGLTDVEQDITVTGAAVGDNCYATPQADPGGNAAWCCYVKAADKVTVRMTAVATVVTTDVTWRADVWKH